MPRPAFPPAAGPAPAEALVRLLASGPAAIDDQEALEVAAGLTAAQAAALLAAFGSLPEVLSAPAPALSKVVPIAAAGRLVLLNDIARRLLAAPLRERPVLGGGEAVAAYLRGVLAGRSREQLLGLFLDKRNRLIRVHLTVRARSDHGPRLNPKKADLEAWRQIFAEKLRERGVEAEATPRRARGVTRKPERSALRRLRDRHERQGGPIGRVSRGKLHEAALLAFGGAILPTPWERKISERQARVRRLYLAQARLLQSSGDPADRALGAELELFVRRLPAPDTERLVLARALRAANDKTRTRHHCWEANSRDRK